MTIPELPKTHWFHEAKLLTDSHKHLVAMAKKQAATWSEAQTANVHETNQAKISFSKNIVNAVEAGNVSLLDCPTFEAAKRKLRLLRGRAQPQQLTQTTPHPKDPFFFKPLTAQPDKAFDLILSDITHLPQLDIAEFYPKLATTGICALVCNIPQLPYLFRHLPGATLIYWLTQQRSESRTRWLNNVLPVFIWTPVENKLAKQHSSLYTNRTLQELAIAIISHLALPRNSTLLDAYKTSDEIVSAGSICGLTVYGSEERSGQATENI